MVNHDALDQLLYFYGCLKNNILSFLKTVYYVKTLINNETEAYYSDRYGWTWFNQDADAWRKISPNIAKKIDQLEARIKELENK